MAIEIVELPSYKMVDLPYFLYVYQKVTYKHGRIWGG